MRSVTGTAAYFKDKLFDLISMIKNIGAAHLFITLSCDETSWPEIAI